MISVGLDVEVILKFQEAGTEKVFFDLQTASFTVSIPAATAADAFEDVAIEAIDEAAFFTMKPSNGKSANVVGIAVTRVLAIR